MCTAHWERKLTYFHFSGNHFSIHELSFLHVGLDPKHGISHDIHYVHVDICKIGSRVGSHSIKSSGITCTDEVREGDVEINYELLIQR